MSEKATQQAFNELPSENGTIYFYQLVGIIQMGF